MGGGKIRVSDFHILHSGFMQEARHSIEAYYSFLGEFSRTFLILQCKEEGG